MRRNFNYLLHFLTSSQFLFLTLPLLFHGYLTYFYTGENRLFVMFNQFTIFISIASLCLVFFRAYIHSNLISMIAIVLSVLFYGNVYFGFFEPNKTTGIYLAFLLNGIICLSLKSLFKMQEIHQIDYLEKIPPYDYMKISFIPTFKELHDCSEPDHEDISQFKIHFKNCYVYGGYVYHNNEKYTFSNVRDYLNEQKFDINHLSNDDFKVISMILI